VIGKPVSFSKEETLDESHAKFVQAIEKLYEKYKDYADYGGKKLEIL
jgi:hypothetical protein